ncbi:metal ABC transporter substrate-binding protein [Tessaracoccus sp. OS52]|uniref:metal ABC transporter substrate-binding protein n=1 Tax=Tessaracoccus sp. OS52 TaxID=2886691 RepID=UPI001D102C3E|nr:metal ABC transporter substrate-binding protein [Tessaracoccus sp. OS52]MCC2592705.1 metal ABC transporter substrate-binding protein [Tessaracoccus sp. OS52]
MRSNRLSVPLAAAALLLSACGADAPTGPDSEEGLQVAAAFYPLAYAAELAGGEGVTVSNLTTPGVEAHDLELSPQQIVALTEADVVVYLEGFQPAVDDAIAQAGPAKVIEVSQFAELTEGPAGESDEGHADEEEHTDLDPHFWLDPARLADVTSAISEELAAVAPEQAEKFAANASRGTDELAVLDEEFTSGLAECERREIFVAHAAFGYLTERYDLEQISVAGLSPESEPSPARVAEVQALAREHGATTIFFESQASDAVAQSIAGDLGLKTAVLDPIESVGPDSAGQDYPSIMRANLQAIRDANGCS